jgi:ABC-type nitrate/sulfonate/bicarbonate transport system permease component
MTARAADGTSRSAGWHRRGLRSAVRFLPVVLAFALWQSVVDLGLVNREFLPSFTDTVAALWHMIRTGEIGINLWVSLYRALGGLAIGSALGIIIGLLMATSEPADRFFGPLVATTYSLPKAALVPLFILWFGIGDVTDMLTVVLACLLPVIVSTYHGVKAVPPLFVWSARAMGTPPWAILWRTLVPASLGSILTGVRIALSFCFVLTISAEMIAAKVGIGKLIFLYGESGAYAFMFGGLMAIVIVAYLADRVLIALIHHLLRWDDSVHSVAAYD